MKKLPVKRPQGWKPPLTATDKVLHAIRELEAYGGHTTDMMEIVVSSEFNTELFREFEKFDQCLPTHGYSDFLSYVFHGIDVNVRNMKGCDFVVMVKD